ncbi:hypothetical protein MP228_002919 [Amoeboaphelidium protococcarum]|nr:hypothetical protein MP228_002919 [Amoeboaphelidium protococcarum]
MNSIFDVFWKQSITSTSTMDNISLDKHLTNVHDQVESWKLKVCSIDGSDRNIEELEQLKATIYLPELQTAQANLERIKQVIDKNVQNNSTSNANQ